MTPLYGHTSVETAYMINSYPYGRMRCRIQYWLESDPKKGFRFCSQTENPKTLLWNNPKKSTYNLLAGCMFLDEENHVHWDGLTEYDDAAKVRDFITKYPEADLSRLLLWCMQKAAYCKAWVEGKARFTINGVPQETTEADIERHREEMRAWMRLYNEMKNI